MAAGDLRQVVDVAAEDLAALLSGELAQRLVLDVQRSRVPGRRENAANAVLVYVPRVDGRHVLPVALAQLPLHRLFAVEYFTFGFGTMVGVGWLVLMDDWLGRGGPAGTMLGFFLGGLLLLPIARVYGSLVRRIPRRFTAVMTPVSARPTARRGA